MSDLQPIIFITGTDTDVGKTFVSSLFVHKWKANYWKPIQTGLESDCGDSHTVKYFNVPSSTWSPTIFSPVVELQKPLCPLDAMKYEDVGVTLSLEEFKLPTDSNTNPLIIEGAGGVFVPITEKLEITTDLIKALIEQTNKRVYIVVVAKSGLGTLNHALLTYEHLCSRGLKRNILGYVLNGKVDQQNKETLELFGLKIIAQVPEVSNEIDLETTVDSIPYFENVIAKYLSI